MIGTPVRCYFAHPISDYGGTPRQRVAIQILEAAGYNVVNPDTPVHHEYYLVQGMPYFIKLIKTCDVLAFLRFPTGELGAGVAHEISAAIALSKPVLDIGLDVTALRVIGPSIPGPVLSVEDTRRLLGKLGVAQYAKYVK